MVVHRSVFAVLLVVSGSALTTTAARAVPVPRGGELRINSYTTGAQRVPAVASDDDGTFLVVWQRFGSPSAIAARRFDPNGGSTGGEFLVSTRITASHSAPDVIATADGSFLVVWHEEPDGGARSRIVARRIDSRGAPVGSEFQVSSPVDVPEGYPYYLGRPSVAAGAGGRFVVAWSAGYDYPADQYYSSYSVFTGPRADAFARIYDEEGRPSGSQFQLNEPRVFGSRLASALYPTVADSGDGFVVAWNSGRWTLFHGYFEVNARRYDSRGTPRGTEFRVGATGIGGLAAAARPAGGFTIAWATQSLGDIVQFFWSEVLARHYSADGVADGPAFRVSSAAEGYDPYWGYPLRPYAGTAGVEIAAGGRFVVVWTSNPLALAYYGGGSSDGSGHGVFGRFYDRSGNGGIEFPVNTYTTGDQTHPAVALTAERSFVVVWHGRGAGSDFGDIFAQRFEEVGVPVCGDADADGEIRARDALLALQASVGLVICVPLFCDADGDGTVTASDALAILNVAVGNDGALACPVSSVSR